MIKEKRSGGERRFGEGTRGGDERRKEDSGEWPYIEKRHEDDRRTEQRRHTSERRRG